MKLTFTFMSSFVSPSFVFIGTSFVSQITRRTSNSSGAGGLMSIIGFWVEGGESRGEWWRRW